METKELSRVQLEVLERWQLLVTYLRTWFNNPDIQAVELALSAIVAHGFAEKDTLFLFFVGPPGTMKTSIIANGCATQPMTYVLGKLTPKTFISGYEGNKDASLLHQLGSSIILLIKDFTTILSMRPDDRATIAADFREIADGFFRGNTGMGKDKQWHGKMTILAACTPAIDHQWAVLRDLGDRFLMIRWGRNDGQLDSKAGRAQRGSEKTIEAGIQFEFSKMLQGWPNVKSLPQLTEEQGARIDALADIVCLIRGKIHRTEAKTIIDLPLIEGGARPGKFLELIARSRAALFRREWIDEEDMRLAERVAIDSAPPQRGLIVRNTPVEGTIGITDLMELTGLSKESLEYHAQDLGALGCMVWHKDEYVQDRTEFKPKFRALLQTSGRKI